jgi:hypothetical protein
MYYDTYLTQQHDALMAEIISVDDDGEMIGDLIEYESVNCPVVEVGVRRRLHESSKQS